MFDPAHNECDLKAPLRSVYSQLIKKEEHNEKNTLHPHSIIHSGFTGLCGQWYYQRQKFT
jgi:hypothetical protein